jgi:outer membrane protein OmpA-like peptidoglycan-associated protein
MGLRRTALAIGFGCFALAGCQVFAPPPPPPPTVRPAAFTALGVSAPYLYADVVAGRKARAAKMKAAKIRPLSAGAAPAYMAELENELRQQTAGIGIDVLRVGSNLLIRIPAAFTFDPGSAAVKPQTDATLLEIARTVKTKNQTFVDVLAHTDTSGSPEVNQALSTKRAAAVATYLGTHGVTKARIASKGLYNPDVSETQKAANRRIEIRLVPYTG